MSVIVGRQAAEPEKRVSRGGKAEYVKVSTETPVVEDVKEDGYEPAEEEIVSVPFVQDVAKESSEVKAEFTEANTDAAEPAKPVRKPRKGGRK